MDSNQLTPESNQSNDQSMDSDVAPHPWDEPLSDPDAQTDEPFSETLQPHEGNSKSTFLLLVVVGMGLGLVFLTGGFYVFTRPCVFGSCSVMNEAQLLSKKSADTLKKPKSGKDILEAQKELKTAIEALKAIPFWSMKHETAQELLQAYQVRGKDLDQLVTAMQMAARAGHKGKNPPHKASKWIAIQKLWREAIARLEQMPKESSLNAIAQQKIKLYKVNLDEVNRRLVKERQANQIMKAAKKAAQIAQARQGVAQTLEEWQLVYSTWKTALDRLNQIPKATTVEEDKQRLQEFYKTNLARARDRKTQEKIATNAYNQGLRLAQLAQKAQGKQQWSVAAIHWRNALNYVKQVPNSTYYHKNAQSLIEPYQNALKAVQSKLQLQVKLKQIGSDLEQICTGETRVCNYTIDESLIKVELTPTYMYQVRQTAITAQVRGDVEAHAGIVNHVLTLEDALKGISYNSDIPMEIYTADGALIQVHSPPSVSLGNSR
ncbi:hypothetical protein BJP37_26580 [Moorena bouillonii PNG]|nr:hypothetical protein BJP37_26580 [Moorena bouillonii PNG]